MRTTRTKEDFLEELTRFVIQRGIGSFTMAQLCQELSCSKRRLYEVAATREEIFLLVVDQLFAGLLADSAAVLQREEQDLVKLIQAYMAIGIQAGQRLSDTFRAEVESNPASQKLFDDYQQQRIEGVKQLIMRGQAAGMFRPAHADVIAVVLVRASLVIRTNAFLKSAQLSMEQAFDELYTLILQGIIVDRAVPKV
ncbi:TetR/AcrR family transcriptional regulator [Lampropedia aestuarii]|uniref:TetR/AcrR family transcriptional regulator n=1 Tax=Lampropedia aestuarii TaxID=2562762 RepID=A0A4S5BEN6_9BURK|nr:TetR/AcrR family transcriptional regulator [Lampropedia aestuarii]THJ30727.1 TetR/AcrR family transcriptional regulator [Lampropedia aestuarii]